jgi:zinc protease
MLKAFHQAWYAPNNAVLVVVGDMDPQTTLEKIQALFGGIAARQLPARPRIQFRSPTALSIRIPTDQPVGTQMIAMRVPGFASPDFPALEVLADVLNSRRFDLYGLVPHGDALSAAFAIDPLPQAGIAYTEVTFPVGADPKTQEARVRAILSKVAQSGVPSELVEAAKVQERSQAEFEKNSIAGLASEWSDAVALYGLRSPDEDLARIEAVTVADVNRVAHRYLDLTHAVSAMMVPQGTGRPIASAGGFGGQESITLKETLPTQLPDWAMAALTRLTIEQSKARPVLSTLPNGLTLITVPEEESNTVSVYGHIRNRSEIEAPAGQQGVGHVLDQMLAYGSEQFDRLKFEAALDEIGAEEHAGTDFDVKALTPDFDRSVELLADNELHPALPPAAMTVIAKQFAQIVTARNRSPGYLVQHSLRAALFPPDDPSLREASAESIGALTLADVANYYRKVFRPDLTSIVVVGNISPERARGTIEKYFGAWTASGAKPETDLPAAPINKAGTVTVADASRAQDIVILAQNLAMARSDPDFYPLEVGNAVLGGGFYSTRLSIELRKKSGLVYSANSILQAGRTRGAYYVEYACDPINVDKASNIVVQELKNIQTVPVGAAELLRVKALLLRRIPLNESSVMEIARGLLGRLELGLPPDEPTIAALRYAEVSPEQVQSAFQRWIRPADFVRVTQGPVPQ